jgi:hypothetical protein
MWFTGIAACGAVAAAVLAAVRVIELLRGHDPHAEPVGDDPAAVLRRARGAADEP